MLNLGSTSLRFTRMVFLKEEGFGRAGVWEGLAVLGSGRAGVLKKTSCTRPWWQIRLRRPFSLLLLRLSASLDKGEAVLIHKCKIN